MGNVCLSGGAEGADTLWGNWASKNEHEVVHYSFTKHNTKCDAASVKVLSDKQLRIADSFLARANKSLKRKWPVSNPYVANLLRRNFYQVVKSDAVYGIGKFVNGQVDGGTAWAVQMYIDRFLIDGEDPKKCKLYFFDQEDKRWFKFNAKSKEWDKLADMPPKPEGIWTGIGTRQLNENGIEAIEKLMVRYPFPLQQTPEPGAVIYLEDDSRPDLTLKGGWGTVAAVQKARAEDGSFLHFVFIQEYGGNVCYNWEQKLKSKQRNLREQFGLERAYMKAK